MEGTTEKIEDQRWCIALCVIVCCRDEWKKRKAETQLDERMQMETSTTIRNRL